MRRREFLRTLVSLSVTTVATAYSNPFRPRLGFAQDPTGRTLVVVFQRGGCDGLNTVVPYGDPDYSGLRPTIGIAPPDSGDPGAAIDLDGFFGLHPALADLMPIWNDGALAILPAVHYPRPTRSHFVGWRLIESGTATDRNLDGWLNRHLVTLPRPAALRAVSVGVSLDHALRGEAIVSSFNDIGSFALGLPSEDEQMLLSDLARVYDQDVSGDCGYKQLVSAYGRAVVNDLAILHDVDPGSYAPENGAVYPNGGYGRQLCQIAQLIKRDLGLEVATLSIAGWDNHVQQGGSAGIQADALSNLAGGMRAFYTDLGSRARDVTVLTMTEFGRTAAENASFGTDHGHASAWFVVGQSVRGGIHGAWPGLRPENLVEGRYLNHSIDFRDVMGEVLSRHLGNANLSALLPGHDCQPVGFL